MLRSMPTYAVWKKSVRSSSRLLPLVLRLWLVHSQRNSSRSWAETMSDQSSLPSAIQLARLSVQQSKPTDLLRLVRSLWSSVEVWLSVNSWLHTVLNSGTIEKMVGHRFKIHCKCSFRCSACCKTDICPQ
jgi:hypothetical protein